MKMKPIFLLWILLAQTLWSYATSNQEATWQQANKAYESKDYQQSVTLYGQLLAQNKDNDMLYYNMGNAYFRLNDLPNAVWCYQKTLKFAPNNQNAQQNLKLVQSRIEGLQVDARPLFFIRWWKQLTAPATSNGWALIGLLFFALSTAALYLGKIHKLNFYKRYVTAFSIGFLFSLLFAFTAFYKQANDNKYVVMSGNAVLLEAPKSAGKILSTVPAGATVETQHKNQNYIKVVLGNGRSGWMEMSSLKGI